MTAPDRDPLDTYMRVLAAAAVARAGEELPGARRRAVSAPSHANDLVPAAVRAVDWVSTRGGPAPEGLGWCGGRSGCDHDVPEKCLAVLRALARATLGPDADELRVERAVGFLLAVGPSITTASHAITETLECLERKKGAVLRSPTRPPSPRTASRRRAR